MSTHPCARPDNVNGSMNVLGPGAAVYRFKALPSELGRRVCTPCAVSELWKHNGVPERVLRVPTSPGSLDHWAIGKETVSTLLLRPERVDSRPDKADGPADVSVPGATMYRLQAFPSELGERDAAHERVLRLSKSPGRLNCCGIIQGTVSTLLRRLDMFTHSCAGSRRYGRERRRRTDSWRSLALPDPVLRRSRASWTGLICRTFWDAFARGQGRRGDA